MFRCFLNFYKDKYNKLCVGKCLISICDFFTITNKQTLRVTYWLRFCRFADYPLGTHGLNYTGTCAPQYHGRLCKSKCECHLNSCDIKFGCMNFQTTSKKTFHWIYLIVGIYKWNIQILSLLTRIKLKLTKTNEYSIVRQYMLKTNFCV